MTIVSSTDNANRFAPFIPDGDLDKASFYDSLEAIGSDATLAATYESERLAAYFIALSNLLKHQIKRVGKFTPNDIHNKNSGLFEPGMLSVLFKGVTANTGNTILSDMNIITERGLERINSNTNHGVFSKYANSGTYGKIGLAFVKSCAADKDLPDNVSIPFLVLEDYVLNNIKDKPETQILLKSLQHVITASNHDMLHHFTNAILNSRIADTSNTHFLPSLSQAVREWDSQYTPGGSEMHPHSYESFLIKSHAGVRHFMGEEVEGGSTWRACDRFLDALSQLPSGNGWDRDLTDYLAAVLCFSLARFLPLNHPLFNRVIDRLEQIDPNPNYKLGVAHCSQNSIRSEYLSEHSIESIMRLSLPDYLLSIRLNNATVDAYRASDIDLLGPLNYRIAQYLMLVEHNPTITYLMAPHSPESKPWECDGSALPRMIEAAASEHWVFDTDGEHSASIDEGLRGTTDFVFYIQNGVLDNYPDGRPAVRQLESGIHQTLHPFVAGRSMPR